MGRRTWRCARKSLSLGPQGEAAIGQCGSLFDVQLVFVFGVAGYLMMRHGFPPVPLLIGFILMPLLEENLRTVLLLAPTYDEHILFVFKRPAFLALLAIMGSAIGFVLWRRWRLRQAGRADS